MRLLRDASLFLIRSTRWLARSMGMCEKSLIVGRFVMSSLAGRPRFFFSDLFDVALKEEAVVATEKSLSDEYRLLGARLRAGLISGVGDSVVDVDGSGSVLITFVTCCSKDGCGFSSIGVRKSSFCGDKDSYASVNAQSFFIVFDSHLPEDNEVDQIKTWVL